MEAERLACWFNSLSLCKEKYPFLADRLDVSLTLQHAEGKLWIKEKLDDLGMHFDNTIIIGVTFDKNVQIKSGSTSPSIVLNSGGTASYKENLDNIIHFSYTVGAGENSSPLNIASLSPFNNGASIIDSIGNEADLILSSAKTVLKNENITIV